MSAKQNSSPDAPDSADAQPRRLLVAELSAVFGGLDRLVTLLRVYPRSHPLVEAFSQQIVDRLNALTEARGEITVRLAASSLVTEHEDHFFKHEVGREHFLWFQPFSDGMASIAIAHGISADELQRLMLIISRADLRQLPPDDDAVTVIWEASLEHVHVTSLDGFVDAQEGGALGELNEVQARALVVQTAITPRAEAVTQLIKLVKTFPAAPMDVFTLHHLRDAAQRVTSSKGSDELAEALRQDPAWLKRLMAEWTAGADLEYRLVEALLSIVRTSPGTPPAQRAADTIVALTSQLFHERAWPSVIALVRLLRARQALFTAEEDPLSPVLALASDPLQLETLIHLCQKERAVRGQLVELLGLLDHALVRAAVLRALADDKRELPAPDALLDVLCAVSDPSAQAEWTAPALLTSHAYLDRMTHAMRGRDLTALARPAHQIYCAALSHADPALRRAALLAYSPVWGAHTILAQHVEPLMSDPEEELRQLAMDLLRRERPESFAARLRAIITQRDFMHRPPGELRFLFKHYLELDREDAPSVLRSLLNIWGWLQPVKCAVAVGAARLLIESGDAATVEIVRRKARAIWIAPALRREYQRLVAAQTKELPA